MKYGQRLLIGALALLWGATLTACTTTSNLERLTSDDSLVLIPTRLSNPDQVPTARNYYLHFSDKRKPLEVGKGEKGFVAVLLREEGLRITGLSSDVTGERVTGESFQVELDASVPYEPGKVFVWDKTFVQTLTKVSSYQFNTFSDFVDTTDTVKADVLATFQSTPQAATWND